MSGGSEVTWGLVGELKGRHTAGENTHCEDDARHRHRSVLDVFHFSSSLYCFLGVIDAKLFLYHSIVCV